jgi:hypothetical protein
MRIIRSGFSEGAPFQEPPGRLNVIQLEDWEGVLYKFFGEEIS